MVYHAYKNLLKKVESMKKEFLIIKTKDAVQYFNIRKIIDVRINLTKEIIYLRYGIGYYFMDNIDLPYLKMILIGWHKGGLTNIKINE